MPIYQGKSQESGTLRPKISPCQRESSPGKGTSETFTVGDWEQFNDWFGSGDDDDDDAFTRDVNSSGTHEWVELEPEDADPTSYQPGSLSPQCGTPPPSDTSSSDSESESASEMSEAQREQEIFCAQRVLVNRAIYPPRRESLLPYRKSIILDPMPLKTPAKNQDQTGASQCPRCSSTIFRMISGRCIPCAISTIRGMIKELELQGERNESEYVEATVRISDRKCAIEDEHPDDYMDDTEWRNLRTEHIGLSEERAEDKVDLEDRVAELEAQMRQYGEWVQEDLDRFR